MWPGVSPTVMGFQPFEAPAFFPQPIDPNAKCSIEKCCGIGEGKGRHDSRRTRKRHPVCPRRSRHPAKSPVNGRTAKPEESPLLHFSLNGDPQEGQLLYQHGIFHQHFLPCVSQADPHQHCIPQQGWIPIQEYIPQQDWTPQQGWIEWIPVQEHIFQQEYFPQQVWIPTEELRTHQDCIPQQEYVDYKQEKLFQTVDVPHPRKHCGKQRKHNSKSMNGKKNSSCTWGPLTYEAGTPSPTPKDLLVEHTEKLEQISVKHDRNQFKQEEEKLFAKRELVVQHLQEATAEQKQLAGAREAFEQERREFESEKEELEKAKIELKNNLEMLRQSQEELKRNQEECTQKSEETQGKKEEFAKFEKQQKERLTKENLELRKKEIRLQQQEQEQQAQFRKTRQDLKKREDDIARRELLVADSELKISTREQDIAGLEKKQHEGCTDYRHVIEGMCQDLMHTNKDPAAHLTESQQQPLSPEQEAAYEENSVTFEHNQRDAMKVQQIVIDPLQRPTISLPVLFSLSKF